MNTVTLNLLAEEQIALQRRAARDPFKFALAIGVSLVALAVGTGVLAAHLAARGQAAVSGLQDKLKSMGEGAIAEQEALYQWKKSLAEDVVTLNQNRIVFAPQLATLKDLVPADIQLHGMRLAITTEAPMPVPVAADSGCNWRVPPKPRSGKKTERLTLRLDGQAVGSPPELVVDRFMTKLREDPTLGPQLEDVQLRSIARGGGSADGKTAPQALFVIECFFKERS